MEDLKNQYLRWDWNTYVALYQRVTTTALKTLFMFCHVLRNDLKNGLVIDSKNSLKYNRTTTVIKPFHNFLGYFNRIDSMTEDNKDYILLRRETKHYSYFSFFREYEGLVNNAFKLFGYDTDYKGEFVWNKEVQEIQSQKWNGRFWDMGTLTIHLEINKGINEICLLITPTNEKQ